MRLPLCTCVYWMNNVPTFEQLIVGSEDFDIRVFSGDAITAEINETEVSAANKANSADNAKLT